MKKILLNVVMICTLLLGFATIVYAAIDHTPAQQQAKERYGYPDLGWIVITNAGKEKIVIHSAAREIKQATKIGIMDGYPDGNFKPNEPITRGEFIKMLIGLATNRSFDFGSVDTAYSQWYGPYVTIAEMQGVINKNQYTEKELEEPITRIEMILMLAKTQIKMKNIPQTQVEDKLRYTDIGYLTKEERALVLHAAQYDLLEGMKENPEGKLNPTANLTRGEAAMAIMRVY